MEQLGVRSWRASPRVQRFRCELLGRLEVCPGTAPRPRLASRPCHWSAGCLSSVGSARRIIIQRRAVALSEGRQARRPCSESASRPGSVAPVSRAKRLTSSAIATSSPMSGPPDGQRVADQRVRERILRRRARRAISTASRLMDARARATAGLEALRRAARVVSPSDVDAPSPSAVNASSSRGTTRRSSRLAASRMLPPYPTRRERKQLL